MIGLSIGSMNTCMSYCDKNQGKKTICEVVLSETSSRTIPSSIGYGETHRVFGEQAIIDMRKNIKSTFTFLNRLSGIQLDSVYALNEIPFWQTEMTIQNKFNDQRSADAFFLIKFGDKDLSLTSESVVAAFINKLRNELLLELHKKEIFAFTFAVPDFFTLCQKEAFQRAVKICKIDNFNLIHESTAILMYYGFSRYKDLFVKMVEGKPVIDPNTVHYVLFLDAGHSKSSFILGELRPNNFRVNNVQVDPFLGGRNLDEMLYDYLIKIFKDKYKINYEISKKAKLRLLTQITKARKVLSSNREAAISVDTFVDDFDFTHLLKRDEFEGVVKPFIENYHRQFESFYNNTFKVLNKNFSAIEMAGDLLRTPILQRLVQDVTKKELSKSIIIDECISKGCALYTASLYDKLSIQGFAGIYHCNPYSICYSVNQSEKKDLLINRLEFLPSTKGILFKVSPIQTSTLITFYYVKEEVGVYEPNNAKQIFSEICSYEISVQQLINYNPNFIKASEIILDVFLDNSARLNLQNLKQGNSNLVINPQIITMHSGRHIKSYKEDYSIVNSLSKLEQEHTEHDENVKRFHHHKNFLESKVYHLKEKFGPEGHNNLMNPVTISENQPRTVLSRLNSLEEHVSGANFQSQHHLEYADKRLKEIENFLYEQARAGKSETRKNLEGVLDQYTNFVDQEYSRILSGQKTQLNERLITKASDLISYYREMMQKIKSDSELQKIYDSFLKEIHNLIK